MTLRQFTYCLALAFFALMLAACSGEKRKVVAVSQCSMDEWRDQMNEEMRREAFFHPDLDVEYHSTADNTAEQVREIESFIERDVDLIVVAPNEDAPLRPVIEKAFDKGIPVVLIDRRADTKKYTAYVGGDNFEVGRLAAKYILDKLPSGGNIIEIEGLANSSASKERNEGFHEIIDKHPEIRIISNFAADWKRDKAEELMSEVDQQLAGQHVDVVFAYNDRMAIGAHEALLHRSASADGLDFTGTEFIGVDALMNDTVGVGRIEDGTLNASFLYSTGGDKAIHTAACILNHLPYERDQVMQTALVTPSNVHIMRLQADHIKEQDSKIEFLNNKLDDFFKQYNAQRIILYMIIGLVLAIGTTLVVTVRGYYSKHRLNVKLERQKEILQRQRDELAEQKETVERQRDLLENERDKLVELSMKSGVVEDEPMADMQADSPGIQEATEVSNAFLQRLQKVVEKNLSNSELTVDMIGAEIGLGRVQLYRRCKAASGLSPNEMLRTARLNKAYKMLREDNEITVSEVAYAVGFSSPSYFAKCYKDFFGTPPSKI